MKYLIIVTIAFLLQSCAKDLYQPNQLTVKVDGLDNEWDRSAFRKVNDANMIYSVARDEEMLYILVKATDEESKQKLTLLGLTIWLDGKGKKKKRQGVQYPQGIMGDLAMNVILSRFRQGRNSKDWDQNTGEFMNKAEVMKLLKRNKNNIGLINFFDDSDEAFVYRLPDLQIPINAEINTLNETLVYELAIPLNLIKNLKKDKISVGLETNSIDMKELMATGRGHKVYSRKGRHMGRRRPAIYKNGNLKQRRAKFQKLNQPLREWLTINIK